MNQDLRVEYYNYSVLLTKVIIYHYKIPILPESDLCPPLIGGSSQVDYWTRKLTCYTSRGYGCAVITSCFFCREQGAETGAKLAL